MQRRLIPTTITLLVLIEVFTVVRTFTVSQLVPPVFTQRVEIQSTRIVQHLRSPIGLIAFFRVGDNDRTPVPQRILVQVNILVRYAFAESFLDGIANCRTGRRADHTPPGRRRSVAHPLALRGPRPPVPRLPPPPLRFRRPRPRPLRGPCRAIHCQLPEPLLPIPPARFPEPRCPTFFPEYQDFLTR